MAKYVHYMAIIVHFMVLFDQIFHYGDIWEIFGLDDHL